MAYQNVEELDQITQELKQAVLQGMTPEERVAGLTPEQLKQAVLKGLTAQQREQLKQLLERQGQDEGQSGEE